MIDFDVERLERVQADRTFKIGADINGEGGETFTYLPGVAPEVLFDYWAMHRPTKPGEESPSNEDVLASLDKTILAFLEPGQEDKWAAVRAPDRPYPVTAEDLYRVVNALMAVSTGRPTLPSSDSTDGRSNGETTSKLESPSPEETPAV